MTNFKLIKANTEENVDLLASMHNLRWNVFHKELKWSKGLRLYNCMEFDEYDNDGAYYIVRVNERNKVDATCRLMPTSKPYMLADHYPEFIEREPIPKTDDVWEFSRTCASEEARISSGGKITAQLIAAAIEFGLVKNIKSYISLTTDTLYPMLKRAVGWDPQPLGQKRATPDDESYSLKYTVSYEMLEQIRKRNKIEGPLIFQFNSTLGDIQELPYEQHRFKENAAAFSNPQSGFIGGNDVHPFIS